MAAIFALILAVSVFHGYVSGYPSKGYALFLQPGVTDYANIWGMKSLTQFTVCFWMKSRVSSSGAVFSYAVPRQDNELLIYNYNGFQVFVGGQYKGILVSANDGSWHHICFSWRNSNGVLKFYKDGNLRAYITGLHTGYTIQAGGSLVLGQEQDSVGGGFTSGQSYRGSLTNVNVWSYVLLSNTIKSMSTSCLSGVGNVYRWSDFIYGVKGKAAVVIPSPC